MRFSSLKLRGAALIGIEPLRDERGFFARTACVREFQAHGLRGEFVQSSISSNARRGTLRGMHFQWPPSREDKLVRCLRGAIFDVLLDLRPGEPTFLKHQTVELTAESRDAVYVPAGVAHGFQTLADDTEVLYQMTDFHAPGLAAGVRWNDPAFGISWPHGLGLVIAARDAAYPDFSPDAFRAELQRHGTAPVAAS